MARSKHTLSSAAKQAKQRAARLTRERQSARAKARKQAARDQSRDLAAQWRALKKLGYLRTKVIPAQKRLTKSRKETIRRLFKQANQQGVISHGKVIRALQRTVTDKGRVQYNLDKHFRLIKSKYKPSSPNGWRKTLKGFIFEISSPSEKIRITKKGKVVRKIAEMGGMEITAEGMTGQQILALADKITAGKFKLKKNQIMLVQDFGGWNNEAHQYYPDALDLFIDRLNRYRNTMMDNVFNAWLDMTEIRIATI